MTAVSSSCPLWPPTLFSKEQRGDPNKHKSGLTIPLLRPFQWLLISELMPKCLQWLQSLCARQNLHAPCTLPRSKSPAVLPLLFMRSHAGFLSVSQTHEHASPQGLCTSVSSGKLFSEIHTAHSLTSSEFLFKCHLTIRCKITMPSCYPYPSISNPSYISTPHTSSYKIL